MAKRPLPRMRGKVELSFSTESITSGGSNDAWLNQLAVKTPRSPLWAAVTA
jgi:hypothetical protein